MPPFGHELQQFTRPHGVGVVLEHRSMQSLRDLAGEIQVRQIKLDPLDAVIEARELGPCFMRKGVGRVPALVAEKKTAAGGDPEAALGDAPAAYRAVADGAHVQVNAARLD